MTTLCTASFRAGSFLDRLTEANFFVDQVARVHSDPERSAVCREPAGGLSPAVRRALDARGIGELYVHQAEAVEAVRDGRNVVVVTGTASGKTLCYLVPVLEARVADPLATALLLFPTKALAQDQLRSLEALRDGGGIDLFAGTYDGDTPQDLRRRLKDRGNVILTNPDMLHAGILPHHSRWARFFTHLKYVVIDEVHAYRGVFGSHVANVMKRLRRITRHYGSDPVFLSSSATIRNPGEHASRICGAPVVTVDRDGSPRGPRSLVVWNPPPLTRDGAEGRRSTLGEAVNLFTSLVREGVQTIVFARTKLAAELVVKNARTRLSGVSRRLASRVHAYRGGYLPEERREIEKKLVSGELLGVASTNALELGIDIGSLDACVILGYPGTVASFRQQAGRAGRTGGESLVFLVAKNTPVDQYLASHPDWLLKKSPERAIVDPSNPHVFYGHLKCAAHELPLEPAEVEDFGPLAPDVLELLEEEQVIKRIDGRAYWASTAYPSRDTNLRGLAGPVYTIEDVENGGRVIGTADELSALSQLHDHAVYLHGSETWLVEELDLVQRIVRVARRDLDYYTQAVTVSRIRIEETEEERKSPAGLLGFGDVTVTTSIPMFKKVRFHSRESVGFEKLDLPPQELETVATWFVPPEEAVRELAEQGLLAGEALVGIANVLVELVPTFLMCEPQDIGAVVDSAPLGRDALFIHDRFPGGMGYSHAALGKFHELLATAAEVIRECPCERGCPSCVGSAVPPFASSDLDASVRGRIPDKRAAALLSELGRATSPG